jgi:two-component system cell cycle sensor histidine kinase/response regulator CckA
MKTIGARLALAFSCVILFLVLQGVMAYITTNNLNGLYREVRTTELELNQIRIDLAQVRLTVFKLLGTMNPKAMDAQKGKFTQEISRLTTRLIKTGLDPSLIKRNQEIYEHIISLHYDFSVKSARSIINGFSKAVHENLMSDLQFRFEELERANERKVKSAQRNAVFIYAWLLLSALVAAAIWGVILARSLTDRQKAEQELRQERDHSANIIKGTPAIIVGLDMQNHTTFINPAGERITGYSAEELIGRSFLDMVYPGELYQQVIDLFAQREQGPRVNYEMKLRTKDGDIRTISWNSVDHLDENGKLIEVVAFGHDITDRTNAEEEQKKLEKQLRHSQKLEALGTLAGGIAHDFNNILAAIIGYTELALTQSRNPENIRGDLGHVLQSAERAKELVRRILAFSRKGEVEFTPLNLNREIKNAAKVLERIIPKMISIDLQLDPDLNYVQGDGAQLEQVLLNLGSNARDAMPEGGRLVIETHNVHLDEDFCRHHQGAAPGDYAQLTFSDTGHGMEKEVLEQIFDPFFTTKEVGSGTGMGMAMVYGIIKSHGGYITCYSEPGRGTTFNLYLPKVKELQKGAAANETSPVLLPQGDETILLVDDEEDLRDIGSRILGRRGYTILQADSGEEALKLYKQDPDAIDLVILDISMPGMGGQRCLKLLMEADDQVKVIIASGYSKDGAISDILEQGAKGFVAKPYRSADLLTALY